MNDIKQGIRGLLKTPQWTGAVVIVLALGVGLTTAVFSLVYGILLHPLPFSDPARLVAIWQTTPTLRTAATGFAAIGGRTNHINAGPANWRDWRAQSSSFEDIALTRPAANFNLTGVGQPERLQGARTTGNTASVLGVRPLIGRWFSEDDDRTDAKIVVLSHSLWQQRFGGDPKSIGQTITLNGAAYQIIGVMPESFRYPTAAFQLWAPLFIPPATFQQRIDFSYWAVGRLKSAITVARAQAELSALMRRLGEQYPLVNKGVDVDVQSLMESDVANVRPALVVAMTAAASVLIVGCFNLAVLLTARINARRREMAVRAALGADARRLMRQLLAEMIPLAIAGGAGGSLAAYWVLRALPSVMPASLPHAEAIGMHLPVFFFALTASIAVVILATLLPARGVSRPAFTSELQQSSRSVTRATRSQRMLVIGQIAIATMILIGGGLFVRSVIAASSVDLGFSTDHVLTLHFAANRAEYPTDEQVADYYQRLEDRLRSIPGVTAVGITNRLPLSGNTQNNTMEFEGVGGGQVISVDTRSVTPGYFDAMGISLLRGRLLTTADRANTMRVGLIDDAIARKLYGSTDPIGQRFRISIGGVQDPWLTIVGVVRHIRSEGPDADPRSQVYMPQTQRAQDRAAMAVRTTQDPSSAAHAVIEQIHRENPNQPVYDVRSLDGWFDRVLQPRRLLATTVGLFGVASLLLACVGVYGLVAYAMTLRTREFGVRLALGAQGSQLSGMVLGEAARLGLMGCAAGIVAAWLIGRGMETLLFGVRGTDPMTFALVASALLGACVLAAALPARRAAVVDPSAALRAE
jgi:predicted permease